jgi:hypothetical protein
MCSDFEPLTVLITHRLQKATGRDRPRLHWCSVGALVFLPIHAAGVYYQGSPECCSDYVVSSYAPTLSALHRARIVGKVATRESALTRPWPALTRLTTVCFVLKGENHNTGSSVGLYIERMITPLNLRVYYDYIISFVCTTAV